MWKELKNKFVQKFLFIEEIWSFLTLLLWRSLFRIVDTGIQWVITMHYSKFWSIR